MKSSLRNEDTRVLEHLREMSEVELHGKVIDPLLKKMGVSNLRYVHGSFERGKDFIYLQKDFFGRFELVVCQGPCRTIRALSP